jgi:cell wall-associated NlpC family hydrolase
LSFALPFDLATFARRRLVTAVVAAAATLVLLPPAAALAAGSSTTATTQVAQAQGQLDAVSIQADQAVEAYDEAQNSLDSATATASAAKSAEAKEQGIVAAAQVGVDALATARYEGTSVSPALAVLLADNPQTLLAQTEVLAQVSRYESASLITVVNADRVLVGLQASSNQAVSAQQSAVAKLSAAKASVDKILAKQQALLAVLQTQASRDQAAATAAAEAASVVRQQRTASRSVTRPKLAAAPKTVIAGPVVAAAPIKAPAASGRAAAALAFAYAQLNKPYRFGGAGMRSFDCSGLTMQAYAAAGISLPHSAAAQQHAGRRVPLSQLQPGDLVFWGNPAYHVGIYIGGGRVLDAPHTGTVVKIQSLWGRPSSAVRL